RGRDALALGVDRGSLRCGLLRADRARALHHVGRGLDAVFEAQAADDLGRAVVAPRPLHDGDALLSDLAPDAVGQAPGLFRPPPVLGLLLARADLWRRLKPEPLGDVMCGGARDAEGDAGTLDGV